MDTHNSGTKLINKSDIRKALNLKGPLGSLAASCVMSLLGLNCINRLYPQFCAWRGREFTKEAMKTFRISTDILPEELGYIPRKGPFIVVSNHPFGGWDGIVLYNTVAAVRPEFKILTNFILSHIPNLRDSFLAVNPFSDHKQFRSSLPGLKAAMEAIEKGGCVGIFPAGEVSTYYKGHRYPADKDWTHTVMKLVSTCSVPVLPVYFDGSNSRMFHLLGRIHPMLRTASLPRELIRRSGSTVTMRIGRPVPAGEIARCSGPRELGQMLRNRVYAMEANISRNLPRNQTADGQAPLMPPVPSDVLRKEMEALTPLFEASKYQCFLADAAQIPAMMQEIGRLREIAFRAAGGGTGKAVDIDEFDVMEHPYKQLIVWNPEAEEILGGYRYILGTDVRFDPKGQPLLATAHMFHFSDKFLREYLPTTIELARSFVTLEYQRTRMDNKGLFALDNLWDGLGALTVVMPNVRYFFGKVTMYPNYSRPGRDMILYFLKKHFGDREGLVTPIEPLQIETAERELAALFSKDTFKEDYKILNSEVRRLGYNIPPLVNAYMSLSPTMRMFGTAINREFGDVEETGILIAVDEILEEKRMRHIQSYVENEAKRGEAKCF